MSRLILHLDMDCFFAAIEERENPHLRGKPIAIGGTGRRGILSTANYPARKFGCHSAMPVFKALELCPHLIILPVRYELYRKISHEIRKIMHLFSELIEPLSIDEAYLDISHLKTPGDVVARQLRQLIFEHTHLTSSAGIAPNKLLAKIASDWNKPNGQFLIKEEDISLFMEKLPVERLWGVGARTREQLAKLGISHCGQLREKSMPELIEKFGKFGLELFYQSRGKDSRPVQPFRIPKSCAVESTLDHNVENLAQLISVLNGIIKSLYEDILKSHSTRTISGLGIKLKFADFSQTTAESIQDGWNEPIFSQLAQTAFARGQGKPIRLVGAFVKFAPPKNTQQLDFFNLLGFD